MEYSGVKAVLLLLEREGYADHEKFFGERAEFLVSVRERDCEAFCATLRDRLNGRVEIAEEKRFVHSFPIKKQEKLS